MYLLIIPHVVKKMVLQKNKTLYFQQKILWPSLVEFGQVHVVLENKFLYKVETWFYSDVGHSLHELSEFEQVRAKNNVIVYVLTSAPKLQFKMASKASTNH